MHLMGARGGTKGLREGLDPTGQGSGGVGCVLHKLTGESLTTLVW